LGEDHLTKPEIFAKYPEELTFDQFDDIAWNFEQQFGLNDPRANRPILEEAFNLIKKHNGELVLYTQVDGDSGERLYSKGHHLVNRTGIWWVVKSKSIEETPFVGGTLK